MYTIIREHILILSSFCIMTLLSCSEKATLLKKGEAVIAGRVTNFRGSTRTLKIACGDVVQDIHRTGIIDSLGNFRIEVELYHPQNIQIFFKKGIAKVFLYPSDSIHLEIDEDLFNNERQPSFYISGNGKSVEFSKNIRDYMRFKGESEFYPNSNDKSANEFLKILRKEISNRDSVLQIFCTNNKVTSDFKKWATRDIRYRVANYLIVYRVSHLQGYDGTVFDKTLFPVNDDEAITTPNYGLHLRHYALSKGIWQDTVSLRLLSERNRVDAYAHILNTIVESETQGLSRDIMCYKIMTGLFEESYEDFVAILDKVEECIECQLLKDVLYDKKARYESQTTMNIVTLDSGLNEEQEITGDFWKELQAKYSGKVIYVDIWATWCGPCKGEIPYARELHDYFEGENIAFVNLCLSSDKAEWKQMIIDNNIKGDNYYFNLSQSHLLSSRLQFHGYPTYLIIDQQGNLIDKHAPRPSSKDEIRNILINLIQKRHNTM